MSRMKTLMLKIQLACVKELLKRRYMRYRAVRDEYSCGHSLASFIHPEIELLSRECDKLFDKCKALELKLGQL